MEETLWYWEFTITVWDEDCGEEDFRSGIVAAYSMSEAMESIEDYYGDEIMEVKKLKVISDYLLDFDLINCDASVDFDICKKDN